MHVPDYLSKNKLAVTFCNVSINHNFLAIKGDESFYRFVGKQSGIILTDIIHPDYRDEFINECQTLHKGESSRIHSIMKDGKGEYHLMELLIKNTDHIMAQEEVLDIRLCNIASMEEHQLKFANDLNKYRSYLSIYHNYLFDYDTETGAFAIFMYIGSKSTPFLQCNISDLESKFISMYTDEKDINNFRKFYSHVVNPKEDFVCFLRLPHVKDTGVFINYKIEGKVIYKKNFAPMVIGVLTPSSSDDEHTIPYYSTPEGRDPATGLLNKRALLEYTNDLLAINDLKVHYMLMIDIDNFKSINDTYGHLFGDDVIKRVSSVINSHLHSRGITGRFGGDEFYIFTTNMYNEQDLRTYMTAMRKEIYYMYEDRLPDFHVTLSIGISTYPSDGNDYKTLFTKADKALYIAKNKGRNRFIIYNPQLHEDVSLDRTHTMHTLDPVKRNLFLANITSDIITQLTIGKLNGLSKAFELICNNFDIDYIHIYNGTLASLLYTNADKHSALSRVSAFICDREFLKCYDENGILTIGSTSAFQGIHREIAHEFIKKDVMASLSFHICMPDKKNLFFFYDVLNHPVRWNDSDVNKLMIISKLIAAII